MRTTPEPRLAAIAARAQTASEAVAGEELVCQAEVVPLQASTGDELVCDEEGAGHMDVTQCLQEPQAGAAGGVPLRGASPGPEFLPVEELAVELSSEAEPPVVVSPDPDDPAWSPVLRAIADRAYHETFDVQSTPGTLGSAYEVASEVRARSRGFSIGVVERNGRVYYKIFGARGARGGIPGRWYAASNLPGTSTELAKLVSPRFGALSGLKRGGIGIGGALEVVGTSLDYAIDPKKEFGTDYAVDVSFDVVKAAGSGCGGGSRRGGGDGLAGRWRDGGNHRIRRTGRGDGHRLRGRCARVHGDRVLHRGLPGQPQGAAARPRGRGERRRWRWRWRQRLGDRCRPGCSWRPPARRSCTTRPPWSGWRRWSGHWSQPPPPLSGGSVPVAATTGRAELGGGGLGETTRNG